MDINQLKKPLEIEHIEFRVQSINKWGYAIILPYKDARADMNRLDTVIWPLNWKREHTRDNKNCIVSIYDDSKKEWVSKEDVWVESYNEQEKGLASDSFKRACFNWWIGRELYEYPPIQVKLNSNEFTVEWQKAKATWEFKIKDWKWFSQFDENGKLTCLVAKDQDWKLRFSFGKYNPENTTNSTSNDNPTK